MVNGIAAQASAGRGALELLEQRDRAHRRIDERAHPAAQHRLGADPLLIEQDVVGAGVAGDHRPGPEALDPIGRGLVVAGPEAGMRPG